MSADGLQQLEHQEDSFRDSILKSLRSHRDLLRDALMRDESKEVYLAVADSANGFLYDWLTGECGRVPIHLLSAVMELHASLPQPLAISSLELAFAAHAAFKNGTGVDVSDEECRQAFDEDFDSLFQDFLSLVKDGLRDAEAPGPGDILYVETDCFWSSDDEHPPNIDCNVGGYAISQWFIPNEDEQQLRVSVGCPSQIASANVPVDAEILVKRLLNSIHSDARNEHRTYHPPVDALLRVDRQREIRNLISLLLADSANGTVFQHDLHN